MEELFGTNVKGSIEGDELVLRVKLSERHGPSSSGKTTIIAKTIGAREIVVNNLVVKLNLQVYTKGI